MQPFQADPGPLMLGSDRPSLEKKEKEKRKKSHHQLSAGRCNLFGVISNEPGPGRTLFRPLRHFGDVYAHMTVLRKTGVVVKR